MIESQSTAGQIADFAPVGIAVVDATGRQSYVNSAFCAMLGWPAEELLGATPPFAYWPPEELPRIQAAFEATLRGEAPPNGWELRFQRRDGTRIDVSVRLAATRRTPDGQVDPDGEFIACVTDVSERMSGEREREELRATISAEQGRLAAVLDQVPVGIMIVEAPGGRVVMTNDRATQLLGGALNVERLRDRHAAPVAYAADGSPMGNDDYPLSRALRGEVVRDFVFDLVLPDGVRRTLCVSAAPIRDDVGAIIAAAASFDDVTERRRHEDAARREVQIVETLHRVGSALASTLDLATVVQIVTDEATQLTGAQFGAFFYNVVDEQGESYTLYTISGVPRERFSNFPMPRNTAVFGPTFRGTSVVRSDDITKDPRYGKNPPYYGKPKGHLPVVSYLAVPVVSRSGEVLGGLFFGHDQPGVFTEEHERIVIGVAGWAAVAIDNARLFESQRRAVAEARAARDEAQRANEAKMQFLAAMSHELRTPLNAIAGYTQLLSMELRGPLTEPQRSDLERIERSQKHLLALIDDVLSFAKTEVGRIALRPTAVALDRLIADVFDLLRPEIEAKGLAHRIEGCERGMRVVADPEKLRQVLVNLVANAVKFTERGEVRVRCERRGATVAVEVRDTGRGIPADQLERIFEPFVQVDRRATTSSRQGVGLGLAISRDLARAMGGDIVAESLLGDGASFTVTMPAANDDGGES